MVLSDTPVGERIYQRLYPEQPLGSAHVPEKIKGPDRGLWDHVDQNIHDIHDINASDFQDWRVRCIL